MKTIIEPFRIRSVEPIRMSTLEERETALEAAHYNLFSLAARDVMIDLLTDSGTGAMSTKQWAALMQGDESYAGSESYYDLRDTVQDLMGYKHVIPVHQGRAAERIIFQILAAEDKSIPNNTHFDTTRANIEFRGTEAVDLPVPEGLDPSAAGDFKGNMDIDRLRVFLEENQGRVPVGLLTITNNGNGGQPVSMQNIRETAELYKQYGIPFLLDAARFAENAYMIKLREEGYADKDLRDIVREMFDYADGCMVSAKKDGMVNMGGLLCLEDDALAVDARNLLILTEGFPTYGGLAGRDMAALAQGLREVLDWDYLQYRHASASYLADGLERLGVPCVRPTGLHAVYIDARALLPHIPALEFPGQTLCCELYKVGGIRPVEIGTLMFGTKDPETGQPQPAKLDLVRLTLPRRVYTQSHVDWILEAFEDVVSRKDGLKGYKILEEAPFLRAFTAKLAPIT
jgi:tyrosine phenol-lyase